MSDERKFRLLWRGGNQEIVSVQNEVLKELQKGNALLVQIANSFSKLDNIEQLAIQSNLLLTQVSDNTNCACEALSRILPVVEEINRKMDDKPDPPAVYVLDVPNSDPYYLVDHALYAGDMLNIPFISTKNGEPYNNLSVIEKDSRFGDITFDAFGGVIHMPVIQDIVYQGDPLEFLLSFKQNVSDEEFVLNFHLEYELPDYIEINGVKWAKGNLTADLSDSSGMTSVVSSREDVYTSFYQFSKKKAWKPSGSVSGWPSSGDVPAVWTEVENPSPDSWRLPTYSELVSLVNSGYKWRGANEVGNEVPGLFFGANAATATVSNPKGCIFLPACGTRNNTGALQAPGSESVIWCSDYPGAYPMALRSYPNDALLVQRSAFFGSSLRLVKNDTPVYMYAVDAFGGELTGGSSKGNYREGDVITLPTSAIKEGNLFKGFTSPLWEDSKALGDTFIMPASSVEVVAVWLPLIETGVSVENMIADGSASLKCLFSPVSQVPDWDSSNYYTVGFGQTYTGITQDWNSNQLVAGNHYYLHYVTDEGLAGYLEVDGLVLDGHYVLQY